MRRMALAVLLSAFVKWLHYYPDEFEARFEARAGDDGHVPVNSTISDKGEIHGLVMLRFEC